MTKLSEQQRKTLNALIVYGKDFPANNRTRVSLEKRGLYLPTEGIASVAGLGASDIPTKEIDVLTLNQPYHYADGVLPKGTQLTVLKYQAVKGIKHQSAICDVALHVEGEEPLQLRIYPPRTATLNTALVPDLQAVPVEIVTELREMEASNA